MDAREREQKRKLVIGMLAALAFHEHSQGKTSARVEAMGIPVDFARMLGLIEGPEKMLDATTVEKGREMLEIMLEEEPKVREDLEAQVAKIEDKGGSHILHSFGVIADRIMEILVPDAVVVEAFLSQQGG